MDAKEGTLYLVGTPIGNLEDMTYRAVRVLGEVDHVFCEDTRRTSQLIRHYQIQTKAPLESFHDHSSPKILRRVEMLLTEGKSIAYVTDAGMPGIADPGFVLVRSALKVEAPVVVVPGPSAAAMVFAASNLPSPKFLFHGFFPRTRGEVDRGLELMRAIPVVHVFYEAPGRILTTLQILSENVPHAQVVLGRELTKLHEEWARGSAEEVFEKFKARGEDEGKIRGEFAIAVSLQEKVQAKQHREETARLPQNPMIPMESQAEPTVELTEEQQKEIAEKLRCGLSSKDVSKELAKKYRLPRRLIYEFIIRRLT